MLNINNPQLKNLQLNNLRLEASIAMQALFVWQKDIEHGSETLIKEYPISTAKNGPGEARGSFKTPRGRHIVRAKIGQKAPINAVFISRRWTGEIYTPALKEQFPDRDWILTRIMWLSGLEVGKNRLGECDTMRRYIYIHGTPNDTLLKVPGSKGCIRMNNEDIIELFDLIQIGTEITII